MQLMMLDADPNKLQKPESRSNALNIFLKHCPREPSQDHINLTEKLLALAAGGTAPSRGGAADFFGGKPAGPPKDALKTQMRISVILCVANSWAGGLLALLESGASPNAVDHKTKRSALELADALMDFPVANLLRGYGADLMTKDDHANWALCLAAVRGDWDAAVEWGRTAPLDDRERPPWDLQTPLMYSAIEGHSDIVHLLIEAGHSPDLLNQRGYSAAALARLRGHRSIAEYP